MLLLLFIYYSFTTKITRYRECLCAIHCLLAYPHHHIPSVNTSQVAVTGFFIFFGLIFINYKPKNILLITQSK